MIRCHIVTSTLFILNVINSFRERCKNGVNSLLIRYYNVSYSFAARQDVTKILFDVWYSIATEPLPYFGRTYHRSCVRCTNPRRIGHSSAYLEKFCACTKIFDVLCDQQRMPAYCDKLKTNPNRWANELPRIPTYANECQISPYTSRTLSQFVKV